MTQVMDALTQQINQWKSSPNQVNAPDLIRQLRKIAQKMMNGERSDHTLQATALVNEAWIKISAQNQAEYQNRAHFYALAAQTMRRILVDSARAKYADKREGQAQRVDFEDLGAIAAPEGVSSWSDLSDVLAKLSGVNPAAGQVVDLKFFMGMGIDEMAKTLEVSPATIKRHWAFAKSWIYRELKD